MAVDHAAAALVGSVRRSERSLASLSFVAAAAVSITATLVRTVGGAVVDSRSICLRLAAVEFPPVA